MVREQFSGGNFPRGQLSSGTIVRGQFSSGAIVLESICKLAFLKTKLHTVQESIVA